MITIEQYNERYKKVEFHVGNAEAGHPASVRELPIILALNGLIMKPALDFKNEKMPGICRMFFIPEVDGVIAAWYYLLAAEEADL